LSELNLKTLQSKVMPNVFMCGEIVDVFGRIGGFNFYWAWVSGRLAGLSAARPTTPEASPDTAPPTASSGAL
jgi:predicted flavoprotein YhiN